MISKKNKALTAGILAAAMSATAIIPTFASAATQYATENDANTSYAKMFESLYEDVITNGQANGYLAQATNGSGTFGVPYHSVETLCVEAPDYGHETTSEAMSYMAWITAMHDVLAKEGLISGSTGDFEKGWHTMEAIIPGWSVNAYGYGNTKYDTIFKQDRLKADTATEEDDPSKYPASQNGVDAINPIYDIMKSAYGSDNGYYLMHWLADVDNWYGFGEKSGQFTFINTFQRGEQESCFETVPQPCLEELKYGMTQMADQDNGNGIKAIFNGINKVPKQYSFTNAPDAEDRAIQAAYFANQYGVGTSEVSALAGKMGDQCRNDMFDKYYKAIGCWKSSGINTQSSGLDSQHFLMAWYTSWGGALTASYGDYSWAWQIGCSHSHQFYQNPLAAYALIQDDALKSGMKSSGAADDYKKSLQRQIEMYLWLQSADGPFAGGCTNSPGGKYENKSREGGDIRLDVNSTFYDMAYVEHPVYADPGSNHWIGNQVWSTQRLAELYYYVQKNGDPTGQTYGGLTLEEALEALVSRWVEWFIENTKFNYVAEDGTEMAYAIPSSLDWSGSPATWNQKYDPNANSGLTCTITGYGQGDIGCVSSLCNTLIYYAAVHGVDASAATNPNGATTAEQALFLANRLMSAQWNAARDEIGIAYTDHNSNLYRVFEQEVYIPNGYSGTMPDGSKLEPGATFSSIRESYAKDEMYQAAKAYYEGNGEDNNGDGVVDISDYEFTLHRFWHMGDALVTTGTMALLYPEVTPLPDGYDPDGGDQPSSGDDTKTLWGDANEDGVVDIADAAAIIQSLGNKDKYALGKQGAINADIVDNGGGVTGLDALALQYMAAGKV
ncbi:MAG: hypothetical protein NC340_02200, partial [Ruminococcus flavefaciens]|nr:hypothetical protein [Ruminococcus flavefaciens]